ncbi:MAG: L-threonylcarbamoyladenylate synthase [Oscillospiraceae bacterium]|nr:L-threonylcarbamoyladenylate synthase [Oscillospiraceae bacterium]
MKEIKYLSNTENDLEIAALLLKNGEIVGIPTETVYGLGADATNADAVRKIFEVKGRPSDNPMIVHICDMDMLREYADDIPTVVYRLAEKFWPGPLTMVLSKRSNIPDVVSAGLDTIGLRMPDNEATLKIIKNLGRPVAAPSANKSGYPSPTTAQHVYDDMNGKIAAVVDAGPCTVGVESTVISFEGYDSVRILRPGYITPEQLRTVVDDVVVDNSITSDEPVNVQEVRSPGMKYKHYSPKARVILVREGLEMFKKYVSQQSDENAYSLIFDYDVPDFPYKYMTYGSTPEEQAQQIFAKLREADKMGIETLYVRAPRKEGVGLAVYNRLIRAAGYEVVES